MRTVLLCLFAAVLTSLTAPVAVEVRPRLAVGRTDFRVTAKVDPHPDNRSLILVIDGPKYGRADVQLNNDPQYLDPVHHMRWFRDFDPGEYTITATVRRVGGRELTSQTTACVSGAGVQCGGSDR